MIVGITNLPEFGILPTTEPRHTGPTRNPWDLERTPGGLQRRRGGGGRVRDAPARARQRRRRLDPHPRRRAAGSSGLKPSRGRVSRGPGPRATRGWPADGVLTRTVADTALALDVLGGYEVGDANWAPRPVEPYVTVDAPLPGQAAGRGHRRPTRSTRAVDEEAIHGLRVGRGAAAGARPRGRRGRARLAGAGRRWTIFISVFGPAIALGIDAGVAALGPRAGRGRDRAALARALRAGARDARRSPTWARSRSCRRSRAGWSPSSPTTTCSMTPGAGRAAAADRRVQRARRRPAGRPRALRAASRPTRRCSTSPASPRSRSRSASAPTGCRPNVQIVGKPLNEDTLLQVALQMEAAHPWAHQRPSRRRTSATRRGVTPSASASRVPRALSISTASICASSQVTSDGRAGERLLGPQRGAQAGQRQRQRAPAAPATRPARAGRTRAG